jgi:hypothetical protein
MNLDSNLKDKISTIAAVVILICGTLLALPTQGVAIPAWLIAAASVAAALATAAIGLMTGKLPDGTKKPTAVVVAENKNAAVVAAQTDKVAAEAAVVEAEKPVPPKP